MADTEQGRTRDEDIKIREYLTEQSIVAYRDAVIEECARVAESFIGTLIITGPQDIAAAIRALKDTK